MMVHSNKLCHRCAIGFSWGWDIRVSPSAVFKNWLILLRNSTSHSWKLLFTSELKTFLKMGNLRLFMTDVPLYYFLDLMLVSFAVAVFQGLMATWTDISHGLCWIGVVCIHSLYLCQEDIYLLMHLPSRRHLWLFVRWVRFFFFFFLCCKTTVDCSLEGIINKDLIWANDASAILR